MLGEDAPDIFKVFLACPDGEHHAVVRKLRYARVVWPESEELREHFTRSRSSSFIAKAVSKYPHSGNLVRYPDGHCKG